MTAAVAVLPVDAAQGLSCKNPGLYFQPEGIASFMLLYDRDVATRHPRT